MEKAYLIAKRVPLNEMKGLKKRVTKRLRRHAAKRLRRHAAKRLRRHAAKRLRKRVEIGGVVSMRSWLKFCLHSFQA